MAYLRQGARVVSVDDALAGYRRATTMSSTTVPPAAEGAEAAGAAGAAGAAAHGTVVADANTGEDAQSPSAAAGTPPAAADQGTTAAPQPTTTTTAPGRAAIEDGVYAFATSGYEKTNALGGSRHDYPSETPVTVTHSECGTVQRWQPLAERWDESELCREPEGYAVRRFTTYHEFFQRGQRQEFTCPAGSYVYRPAAPAGDAWSWGCSSDTGEIETVTTVVGFEDVEIDGRPVRTVHMRYSSQLSGANRGTQVQDRWLVAETGFNVRIKTDVDLEADSPFGTVHYEEHYDIVAMSLTPRR